MRLPELSPRAARASYAGLTGVGLLAGAVVGWVAGLLRVPRGHR